MCCTSLQGKRLQAIKAANNQDQSNYRRRKVEQEAGILQVLPVSLPKSCVSDVKLCASQVVALTMLHWSVGTQAREEIEERKKTLEEAKIERQHKEEYEV